VTIARNALASTLHPGSGRELDAGDTVATALFKKYKKRSHA